MSFLMKNIACIDMEGVLIPELWPHIAEATGISDLAITTREEPDYARLVNRRIELLRKNSLRLIDVQALIERVDPLPGAYRFLTELRQDFHVVLVSDAFQEMILPLWEKLDQPELRCHWFTCDRGGYISKAHYSRRHGKHEVIEEFSENGHRTLAVGDAFNDLTMLRRASMGFLFFPSPQTLQAAAGIRVARTYSEILAAARQLGDQQAVGEICAKRA
jgi:phosphoserine/homoserine phosphotransferase